MDVQQQLAALDTRVSVVERAIEAGERRVERRLESMEEKLSRVHDVVTGARGGFRVFLFFLGAFGAGLAVGIAEIVKWMRS